MFIDRDEWRRWEGAACQDPTYDPDMWFPGRYESWDAAQAIRVCKSECPLTDDCLSFALETRQPDGVWGGLGPGERRVLMRRARGGAVAVPA